MNAGESSQVGLVAWLVEIGRDQPERVEEEGRGVEHGSADQRPQKVMLRLLEVADAIGAAGIDDDDPPEREQGV